jgi:hypothetical protein
MLGITGAAVGKAISEAETRAVGDPLADYLELDLPHMADMVPTVEEWQNHPLQDREGVAQDAAQAWQAIAFTTGRLARQLDSICQAMYAVDFGKANAHELELARSWPTTRPPFDDREFDEVTVLLLADLAESLKERAETATRMSERWARRAHYPEGLPADDDGVGQEPAL